MTLWKPFPASLSSDSRGRAKGTGSPFMSVDSPVLLPEHAPPPRTALTPVVPPACVLGSICTPLRPLCFVAWDEPPNSLGLNFLTCEMGGIRSCFLRCLGVVGGQVGSAGERHGCIQLWTLAREDVARPAGSGLRGVGQGSLTSKREHPCHRAGILLWAVM